jgi:hypothetical protein
MPIDTTSTKQKLGKGPAAAPEYGGSKPTLLGDSTRMKLGQTAIPVAAFGAKAQGGGKVMSDDNATVKLNRTPTDPYAREGLSETTPRTPFPGKGRRK